MKRLLKIPPVADAADYERHFRDDLWQIAAAICRRHRISYDSLCRSSQGENIIFLIDDALVLKIYAPFRNVYLREKAALEFAHHRLGIETPAIIHTGEIEGWSYIVMTQLQGLNMREVWPDIERRARVGIVSQLGFALRELHSHDAPLSEAALNGNWSEFIAHQARTCVERQRDCGAQPEWLKSLPEYIAGRLRLLDVEPGGALLHGDVHPGNVLLAQSGAEWRVTGLFDFGDSLCGFHEYEFVAPGVLMFPGDRDLQRAFLLAYGYREAEMDLNLRARLMLLTVLYECSNLRKYALRLAPEALHYTLEELEAAIWTFADE